MEGGGERSTESPSGDDMGVGEYVSSSSQRSDQPYGRGEADREGCGAVASRV